MDQYDAIPDELRERHGFPKDVWKAANDAWELWSDLIGPEIVAKAIMAERNRSADVAKNFVSDGNPIPTIQHAIARAIRGEHQ